MVRETHREVDLGGGWGEGWDWTVEGYRIGGVEIVGEDFRVEEEGFVQV